MEKTHVCEFARSDATDQHAPPERVEEVYDFVLFLKTRPPSVVEDSDAWSEEDQRDAIRAGLHYAESLLAAEEEHDV